MNYSCKNIMCKSKEDLLEFLFKADPGSLTNSQLAYSLWRLCKKSTDREDLDKVTNRHTNMNLIELLTTDDKSDTPFYEIIVRNRRLEGWPVKEALSWTDSTIKTDLTEYNKQLISM